MQELHRTGGNRDSTLGGRTEGAHKVSCALGPKDSIGPWARHTCRPWRVFWGGGGQVGSVVAHCGGKDIASGGPREYSLV